MDGRQPGGRPPRGGPRRARRDEPAQLRPRLPARDGFTPAAYVERLRVEAARQALEGGSEPIALVATRCGFGTPETMRRAFARRVGVAPADYRARFRQAPERAA